MIQPYSLGNALSQTRIDGTSVVTGTLNAQNAVVPGSITTGLFAAKSVTASVLAIGPQFQFTATLGGTPMLLNTDGSISLPTSGNNPLDNRWVVDASRSYPAAQLVKTYATTFAQVGGNQSFGILLNLTQASAYANSGNTALLVWIDGSVNIYTVTGIGVWTIVGSYAIPGGITGNDRVVIQHYGAQSSPRMRVFVNGVEYGAGLFTDAFLGTSGGVKGGCAGYLLAASSIKLNEITMGNLPISMADGTITAQTLNAASIQGSSLVITSILNGVNNGMGGATTINGGYISTGTITSAHIVSAGLSASVIKTGYLAAGLIQANSLTTGMLKVQNFGACLNPDPQIVDATVWTSGTAGVPGSISGSCQTIADGMAGCTSWRSTSTPTPLYGAVPVMIDPNKNYRVSAWARSSAANGVIYIGLACLDKNGVNIVCPGYGTYAYPAAVSVGANSVWTCYSGSMGGAGGVAVAFPAGTVSVVPIVLANWGGSAGYWEVQDIEISAQVPGSLIVNGSITANHINTSGLDGGSIKTGYIRSQGSGGVYASGTYSGSYTPGNGFALYHIPQTTLLNVWGRAQANVQAEFASTILVGGYPLGKCLAVPLSALDFPAMDTMGTTPLIFYRGMSTPGTGPIMADNDTGTINNPRLLINTVKVADPGGTYNTSTDMHFQVQPNTNADNLDAVSHIEVTVWYKSGTSMVSEGTIAYPACSSRRYRTPATPSDPTNAGHGMWSYDCFNSSTHSAPVGLSGASYPLVLQCRICNVYGESSQHYFIPPSAAGTGTTSATGRWTDMGTAAPYTGGGTGGSGGGGGGSGGGCVPAGTLITMRDGTKLPIETIEDGMEVMAFDENTLRPVSTHVIKLIVHDERNIWKIVTDRGEIVCSHDHRLARVIGVNEADYPPTRDLSKEDIVLITKDTGWETAVVLSCEPLNYTDKVYHVALNAGHIYVAGDFLAHNSLMIKL